MGTSGEENNYKKTGAIMIIVIDKGHSANGKPDPGAVGNGLKEADLTEIIGNSVIDTLKDYEVYVYDAPRGKLPERTSFAKSKRADLLLSIHINSGGGQGYESYVGLNASGQEIANITGIHTYMANIYSKKGFKDRGIKKANFYVLDEDNLMVGKNKIQAVLLENLFIDNNVEANFLKSNAQHIGREIANAIIDTFHLLRKGSDDVVEQPSWKSDVMKWAESAKLIMPDTHKADEPATKIFVLSVLKNLKEMK